jgi:cytoskeletal protein CcmA (bactofilin family)
MTVSIANTNLNDNFNTWRLNTNFAATVISNNVVTVARGGSADRGGYAKGNGHIDGTFSAGVLRTNELRSGNTSDDGGWLDVFSNTTINSHSFSVTANTIFQGNVDFLTTGSNRVILGDVSRIRMTGGTRGQFLRLEDQSDVLNFKSLTLRDLADLSSNSAHIILSGANTAFSDNNDSPALILSNGTDRAKLFMASGALGQSDVFINLVDDDGDSKFVITDSANVEIFSVDSDGRVNFTSNVELGGVSTTGNILPETGYDDQIDLGAPNREWRNLYVDGVANIDELSMGTSAGQGVSTSLIPKTDAAGNLGSTTRKWGTVWADNTNGGAGVFSGLGVSGNLNSNGNLTVAGTGSVTGATALANTLTVTGKTIINSNTVITANTSLQDRLDVSGNTSLSGDVDLGSVSTDTITVKGNFANQSTSGLSTFDGNVKINSSLVEFNASTKTKGNIVPDVDDGIGHYNLGSTSERFNRIYANNAFANNMFIDNDATISGDLTILGSTSLASGQTFTSPTGTFTNLTVTGTTSLEGSTTIGDSSGDTVVVNSKFNSALVPTGTQNLGTSLNQWSNLYLSGSLQDGSTTIIGKNNQLHANNTITDGTIRDVMLENSGVTAGTYGDASSVPRITVDSKGLVTSIGTQTVSGVTSFSYNSANNDFEIGTATGTTYNATISDATTTVKGVASFNTNDFTVTGGAVSVRSGSIKPGDLEAISGLTAGTYGDGLQVPTIAVNTKGQITSVVANSIPISSTSDIGLASFDSTQFDVTSGGAVSLKGGSQGAVTAISGTANEIEVSRNLGTVTVGLPDDVTITGQLNVSENIVVAGNLVVQGTTTTVNSETVNIADNIIILNSNETGTPSQDGGISIERGTATNKSFLWDETNDRWTLGAESLVASNFIGTATQVGQSLSPGSYLTGSSFNGSTARTFAVDATNLNTASKVVARDSSGNFSAGTISASLNGNASTASKWQTARTVNFNGGSTDVSGSFAIDGSNDVTGINLTIGSQAVGSAELATGAVTTIKLAADSVTTSKIENSAVATASIADDAITKEKLANLSTLHIKNSSGTILKTLHAVGEP